MDKPNSESIPCENQGVCQHAESADHFRKMYERISGLAQIGVWEFDLAIDKLSWTDTVYDLFDLPRQSAINRADILRFYDTKSRREMERLRHNAIRSGTGFSIEIKVHTAIGNEKWIRITANVEREDGNSVRIFGTKQDISAERAAQERVQTLQTQLIYESRGSAMEAMASTLAHEIIQPLTAVTNYLETARRIIARDTSAPELVKSIDAAIETSLRTGKIIHQLRRVIRTNDFTKKLLDLEEIVDEAVTLITADWPNITVKSELVCLTRVEGDRLQIQQVIISLLQNICQASRGAPCQVDIRSFSTETHLEICVSDTGPGFPENILPKVFDSFVTAGSDSLGIGLAISRTIIEAHGGQIAAKNLPNGGAAVHFTLPYPEE